MQTGKFTWSYPKRYPITFLTIFPIVVLSSLYSYALFHFLTEIYGIFLAFSIFSIPWNVRRFLSNRYFLFMGVAFSFIGVFGLLHLLVDFALIPPGLLVDSAAQINLTVCYLWGISLCMAPFFLKRYFSYPSAFGAVAAATLAALAGTHVLMQMLRNPAQQSLAVVLYLAIFFALMAGATILLLRNRTVFENATLKILLLANFSFLPAITPLLARNYPFLVATHLFKIIALTLYHRVVIQTGLLAPYEELKQSQEALAAEKERLDVTLRSLGEGVIATDNAGRVSLINRVAEELTGWSQAEAIGRPLQEVYNISSMDSEERSGQEEAIRPAFVLLSRNQRYRFIAASGAAIRDSAERIIGQVYVFRDITEKQKLEEELLKNQKLKSLGILAGGIAHDFHNILAVLLGNVQLSKLLLEKGKDIGKYLDGMEESIKNAARLTKQLLTFSKGGTPIKHRIDIGNMIIHTAKFALKDSVVKYQFTHDAGLWPVEADEGQISQVVHNLLINAAQAMPDGGTVRIYTKNILLGPDEIPPLRAGRYVKIVIQDQGTGISKENLPYIFDPFFTTKQTGNGLGLAAAYSIINRHEGYISVESEPGQGTTFAVYLPAQFECGAASS